MTEKIKFNKNLSKKLSLDTMTDLGPSDTQGIEIKSPGKMHWLTIKGETWDDIQTVLTTELYDPDGELSDYIIQVEDKGLLEKIQLLLQIHLPLTLTICLNSSIYLKDF